MKNIGNEKFLSRRELFKKAAKGALPILAAVVLAGNPLFSAAKTHERIVVSGCDGCRNSCTGSCTGMCAVGCSSSDCRGACHNSCKGGCSNSCVGSSK